MVINHFRQFFSLIIGTAIVSTGIFAENPNQTAEVSPVFPNSELPFDVKIELADFQLPDGIHSYSSAQFNGLWLFIGGRTNGMHTFYDNNDNFPPSSQNTTVYVVDPTSKSVASRSLQDTTSGLSQHQIDLLSVTSAQFYQSGAMLYITGGYGVDSSTGNFSTKDALTAINVPGLIHWVVNPDPKETASQHIRQIFHPAFQVTGGEMFQMAGHPTVLVFGQNFEGFYLSTSDGIYTEQVRRFHIRDNGIKLSAVILPSQPVGIDPNFRRRDLNIIPIIRHEHNRYHQELIAYSGVFTVEGGIWTIPVKITGEGRPSMYDLSEPDSFKQGMNNYTCAQVNLYSKETNENYSILFGGMTYGFFVNGTFHVDDEIPFTNQVTTIKIDKKGNFSQYLMDGEYPIILSTQSNPKNRLFFGAGAELLKSPIPTYTNGVINLDAIKTSPTVIGYIVGGIQSKVPNTHTSSDSAASSYIFKVTLIPRWGS